MPLLRWPAYYSRRQQTFTVQNKPAAVAPKETITHHFSVSELQKKPSMQSKFVAAQKMLLKQKTQQTFVNDCSVLLL